MGEFIIEATLIIIVILELLRWVRGINKSFKDIDEIKERLTNIEELLKNQNK